ncbi:MAG: immune inhibitor A [Chloroflexi bacterium]|nr:immune inhibitor A [Chloroflexota bacterium]
MLTVLAWPVQAQNQPPFDPLALARELLGFAGEPPVPPPAPVFQPGDSDQFWVSRAGQDAPVQVSAELAAATPNIYLWVENGLEYDPAAMQTLAGQLNGIFNLLLLRDNYGQVRTIPRTQADYNARAKLALPDVDNDPHLSILFAAELRDTANASFNPMNSVMAELAPGGFSNQRELLLVNTATLPGVPLHDPAYAGILARQMVALLTYYNYPDQPAWLTTAVSWHMLLQLQRADLTPEALTPFLDAPETGLLQPPALGSAGQEVAAQQLFLRYVLQRFGGDVFTDFVTGGGKGLQSLDAALKRASITDLVTGEPLTAGDVFADFVLANILNGLGVGDGRFQYRNVDFGDGQPTVLLLRDNLNAAIDDGAVNQLGTRYLVLTSATPAAITVAFSGQPTVNRLPMPPDDRNQFYWTGAANGTTALTRAVDLRGVRQASLTFDAWYALAEGWNYAYVQVSTDGGASWTILPASSTGGLNPYGMAYGPAFTGISNADGPRPFPYLGVGLGADGITITTIVPDGPLAGTGVQAGDVIAGFDGQPWPGQPNLLGWLATHAAGDTVNLYMQRGDRFFDVPVTLGAHPTRIFQPDALWLPQSVDLSAYAGQEILLRFQTISLPGRDNPGFAVDNIAIPEINFSDDAEGDVPGWTLAGWRQMSNSTPQQFLVQTAHIGEGTARVRRLIAPVEAATSGAWPFSLAADDFLIVAVSGLNDDTTQPARFALNIREETGVVPTPTATP